MAAIKSSLRKQGKHLFILQASDPSFPSLFLLSSPSFPFFLKFPSFS